MPILEYPYWHFDLQYYSGSVFQIALNVLVFHQPHRSLSVATPEFAAHISSRPTAVAQTASACSSTAR